MSFPKYLYHKTEGAKLIESEEQEKALGKGWADSPAAFDAAPSAPGDDGNVSQGSEDGADGGEPSVGEDQSDSDDESPKDQKEVKALLIEQLLAAGKKKAQLKGKSIEQLQEMLEG